MADDTPPPELVQARRDFMAADAELAALAAGAPSAIAQDGRVVGVDPELAARMAAVHARMQQLALFIVGHDWLGQAANRVAAWQRVDQLAKASPQ
jgi:hypothetical protein